MMNASPTTTQGALLRMSGLLAEITDDMTHVAQLVSELSTQDAVTLSSAQITDLQTLDRICQSLRDLVVITESLATAPGARPGQAVDVQLATTRSILAPEPGPDDDIVTGSIELF
ncbi:hypothetical protein [uncultured Tateyamaria sp.]|uniref:hypothetical protein n=1 Tax=uncultured Tateyamaria sp. TaxID=455651 RepID=UPI0026380F84|nr:hypothetical protein [uncultured Tateyamaria sp.]